MTTRPADGTPGSGSGRKCYAPLATATARPSPDHIKQPWITTPGGSPSQVLDPTKLTGVQWQFTIPAAADGGATVCVANLNLTNVKFYH